MCRARRCQQYRVQQRWGCASARALRRLRTGSETLLRPAAPHIARGKESLRRPSSWRGAAAHNELAERKQLGWAVRPAPARRPAGTCCQELAEGVSKVGVEVCTKTQVHMWCFDQFEAVGRAARVYNARYAELLTLKPASGPFGFIGPVFREAAAESLENAERCTPFQSGFAARTGAVAGLHSATAWRFILRGSGLAGLAGSRRACPAWASDNHHQPKAV